MAEKTSDYCEGKYDYWIASADGHPFALLMTIQETTEEDIDEIKRKTLEDNHIKSHEKESFNVNFLQNSLN